jgi:hypothetical protein
MPPQFRLRKPTLADAPFVVWLDTPFAIREYGSLGEFGTVYAHHMCDIL